MEYKKQVIRSTGFASLKSHISAQRKVASGKFPFYTPGGVNVVHIDDVIYCLQYVHQKGRAGERYIVAGENLTIKDLFAAIAEVAGVSAPTFYLPSPILHLMGWTGDHILQPIGIKGPLSGETAWTSSMYHWFSSEKAQRELLYKPTPAKMAIRESVQWMKDHGYLP